jgi:hypothetical protein
MSAKIDGKNCTFDRWQGTSSNGGVAQIELQKF